MDHNARLEEVDRLKSLGVSQSEIARQLNVSRTTVRKDLKELASRAPASVLPPPPPKTPLVGGRKTKDTANHWMDSYRVVMPPPDFNSEWFVLNLDRKDLMAYTPAALSKILLNLSPEISRGLWDYLLMLNPGHKIIALKPKSEDPDEKAQEVLDAFLAVLDQRHGARDVLFARTNMGLVTRGAIINELILDETATRPLNIVAPDPYSIRFRKYNDPVEGEVWEMGQWQLGQFNVIDSPTVIYVPVHPEPASPYGRSMITPSLFPALFMLGLMSDLRRVVAQQGYPRLDVEIVTERLFQTVLARDTETQKQIVDEIINQVTSEYQKMEPDDTFVHTDVVKVNRPVGAVDSSSLGGAQAMLSMLERTTARALKTMPLLMGVAEGTSEANANRQWEIFSKGVKTLQHLHEQMLGSLLTLALEVQGVQSVVAVRFAELRAAEEQRDALTFKARLENAMIAIEAGFWNQNQASLYAVDELPFITQDEMDKKREEAQTSLTEQKDKEPSGTRPDEINPGADEQRIQQLIEKLDGQRADEDIEPSDEVKPVKEEVEVDDRDIETSERSFDVSVPDYSTMLDADAEEEEAE